LESVRFGQVQEVVEAIGAVADVNARDFQKRPALWVAASEGHLEIMNLLLRHGAEVNARLGRRKQSLLHWAAENSAVGMASVLLRHGAEVNARMSDGITSLMLATLDGQFYIAEKLLKPSALLSPRSRSGRSDCSMADR
jgi:ankyrin repeat protein